MGFRRAALASSLIAALAAPALAVAGEPQWRHGTALLGEVKYPSGFKRFDYVNPNAPKGGVLRLSEDGTFDSLNPILTTKGNPAAGLGFVTETLMTGALDEVASEYGLIAEAMRYPDDYSWVAYRLRPEARWHDGTPITPEDVVWSFETITKLDPRRRFYYQHVKKAEKTGEREVTFAFDQAGNRELPQIVGQLAVLPKHWWEGTDANGRKRDISQTILEPPLGSGPYRIKSFEPGRTIVYERVPDYWGKDLPVNVGSHNVGEIRYEYYRDAQVELEVFKAARVDVRFENTAKQWATAYDFPAVRDGRVVLEKFPDRASGIMSGFVPNLRRPIFQDARVRLALSYALNFEELNRTNFYDQYERVDSYYFGTELAASGSPTGLELEILNEAKTKGPIPDEVFTKVFSPPKAPDNNSYRDNLRRAVELLAAAGWKISSDGGRAVMRNAQGEPLSIEFLISNSQPAFERIAVRYRENLARIGVDLRIRAVDQSQYINRFRNRDFDLIYSGWGQSLSPGNEQLDYWGSESAEREGSGNYAGIKNPAIDHLIGRIVYAKSREELVAATRALDRVLLWNHYVIPGWTLKAIRMARWNRYSYPEPLPKYGIGFPTIWWWDAEKARKTGGAT